MVLEVNKKTDIKPRKNDRFQNPPSKIVIRKLPPTYTEENFKNAVAPLPDYNYFYFAHSDKSLGAYSYSRAYISFVNPDEIVIFKDKFDGYVFVDQKGNEFPAIVEYAPFQKIPKVPNSLQKKDPRCATIDEDSDYLSFLENLNNPEAVLLPQIENILEEIENHEKELKANNGVPKIKTPLLEYIHQRSTDRLRSADKRRRKEFDRKRTREEEKRRRKDVKEFRKKDDRVHSASHSRTSGSTSTYADRQRRREEERQRLAELRDGKKQRRTKEFEKHGSSSQNSIHEDKEGSVAKSPVNEEVPGKDNISFKSKRYSEARKKDGEKKNKGIVKESKSNKEDSLGTFCETDEVKSDFSQFTVSDDFKEDIVFPFPVTHDMQGADEKSENSLLEKNANLNILKKEIPTDGKKAIDKDDKSEDFNTDNSRDHSQDNDYNDIDTSCESRQKSWKDRRDPRTERRIRNKDRPDMQLYRPGQSRLTSRMKHSQDDLSQEPGNEDSSSSSQSPSPIQNKEEEKNPKMSKDEPLLKEKHSYRDKKWTKESYKTYEKKGYHYRESKGSYGWEKEPDKDCGKYHKHDYDGYEEPSVRKGYSYNQERENKNRRVNKHKEQDSSQVKSRTFHRSASQD